MSLLGISKNSLFKYVNEEIFYILVNILKKEYLLNDLLKQELNKNLKFYVENKSIKGYLYKMQLPVRGQRTHTNARTCKRIYFNYNV